MEAHKITIQSEVKSSRFSLSFFSCNVLHEAQQGQAFWQDITVIMTEVDLLGMKCHPFII